MPLNLIFTQAGDFTIEDNGIPGDNISVIKDGAGIVIFTFAHPVDALGLTVNVPGVNLTINFTDSLGAADFTIGSLTDPAVTPDSVTIRKVDTTGDVTIVANGSITEGGSDAAADIVAGSVIMSAASGVGTAANAIETQTSFIEAETTTGGINIGNTGSVQIGGLTDLVNGLDVLTSGNLNLTVLGSIFLSDIDLDPGTNPPNPPAQSVHGGDTSGSVTLTANGFLSDIITNTDTDAISAPRGNITLNAGRDVAFGTIGVDFDNDVRANGNVTINAGRDFLLDGFSDLSSDDFFNNTGGDVIINTGRNIQVRDIAGSDATITASGSAGANVTFTTGFSGAVILDAPSTTAVQSVSGDVIVNADRMLIGGASGITANAGDVILRPATEGRAMLLGSASDAALALELADSELDRMFTNSLIIGGTNTGLVRVIAPIAPGNAQDITLRSGTDISIEANITTIDALALYAGYDIQLLAARTLLVNGLSGGSFVAFVDQAGDDGGIGGIGTLSGTIAASAIELNGNIDNDTLNGTAVDDIIRGGGGADQMTGKTGDDIYYVDDAGDVVTEAVGEGTDQVRASINYTLADNVERLTLVGGARVGNGNGLDNIIAGSGGQDTLRGQAGDDILRGNDGRDTLIGASGEDLLDGGASKDTMTGSAHRDVFQFSDGDFGPSRPLADIITDFSQADNEKIHLGLVDADTTTGGNQAFSFIGTGAFTSVAGQLRYAHQAGNTYVEGDLDGDSVADIFIRLDGLHNLVAGDFVL